MGGAAVKLFGRTLARPTRSGIAPTSGPAIVDATPRTVTLVLSVDALEELRACAARRRFALDSGQFDHYLVAAVLHAVDRGYSEVTITRRSRRLAEEVRRQAGKRDTL